MTRGLTFTARSVCCRAADSSPKDRLLRHLKIYLDNILLAHDSTDRFDDLGAIKIN